MHRYADRPARICDTARDRLTNPPGSICTELITLCIVKLVHSLHQAHIALLDQIQKRHTSSYILLGDTDHQSEVRFSQLFLGFFIALLYSLCQLNLFITR